MNGEKDDIPLNNLNSKVLLGDENVADKLNIADFVVGDTDAADGVADLLASFNSELSNAAGPEVGESINTQATVNVATFELPSGEHPITSNLNILIDDGTGTFTTDV